MIGSPRIRRATIVLGAALSLVVAGSAVALHPGSTPGSPTADLPGSPTGGPTSTLAPSSTAAPATGEGTRSPAATPRTATPTATPTPTHHPTAGSSSTASPAPPGSAPSALHVSGNHLVNSAGQVVTLHGADMSGSEFVCVQESNTSDPFGGQPEDNPATFAAMKSWGINVVRIPLNEDCWLGINGAYISGAAYQDPIIQLVDNLEADGFYVILDLHWSGPGTQEATNQNDYPDADHSPAFWSSVASTFKADPGVLFDLYNEPIGYWIANGESEWQCLWQGCEVTELMTGSNAYTSGVDWQTAGFTQLTSSIRATGAQNVIMAACMGWAEDCSDWASAYQTWSSEDANTAVSWHAYPGSGDVPSEDESGYWNPTIAPLAAKHPVIIGETGDLVTPPTPYLSLLLPWTQQHSIAGVLAWTWNAWGNPSDVLVSDMESGTPTAGEGVTYQDWLRSLG